MIDFLKNEISSWDYIMEMNKTIGLPVVMYGMGNGADRIIKRLERNGVSVNEFIASDNFVRGQSFHGKRVKRLDEIESEYSSFLVVIAFGTQRDDVIDNINRIAMKHKVIVPTVPVFGENIFDDDFISKHEEEILKVLEFFDEEKSISVFKNIVKFNYSGKLEYLFAAESDKSEVYNNILCPGENERFLDLGAYRGDTVDEFLNFTGGNYKSITALEPDTKTFRKLTEHCAALKNFTAINAAAWSDNRELFFDKKGGRMSAVAKTGEKINAISVDSLNDKIGFSYIKADVEGCEYNAIIGAEKTLRRSKPKLNFALYHRSEDIFSLPLLIKDIQPEYKFFIRHHPYIPAWDTNLYCV